MTVTRLIRYLTALPDYAARQLPEDERRALARECLRLARACEVGAAPAQRSGVLADLRAGERSP